MTRKVTVRGKRYEIKKSTRKNKQLMAIPENPKQKPIHFGDPNMPEYPGTPRGDNYCKRSLGIKGTNDPKSPNFWSRKYLWNCIRGKSMKKKQI